MTHKDTKTAARARLEQVRAELARRDEPAADAAPVRIPVVGDVVHVLRSNLSIPTRLPHEIFSPMGNIITTRGQSFILDDRLIRAARTRDGGHGWIGLVHDPDKQMRQFGEIRYAPGRAPDYIEPWEPNSVEWEQARERARTAAHAIPNPEERAAALREVHRRYGAAPVTSVTLNAAPHPSIAAAEAQRDRLARQGVRHDSTYAPTRRDGD